MSRIKTWTRINKSGAYLVFQGPCATIQRQMSKPPGTSNDYSASDVLAPQFWTGKAERLAPGVDVACTKIAVDLQNLTRDGAEECIARCLDVLRDAASADAAFTAFFNPEGTHIESVLFARGHFAQCHPEALKGAALTSLPWFAQRSEHLRLSEYRDTAAPRAEQAEDSSSLAELAIGAALLVSFRIREQPAGFLALGYGLPR